MQISKKKKTLTLQIQNGARPKNKVHPLSQRIAELNRWHQLQSLFFSSFQSRHPTHSFSRFALLSLLLLSRSHLAPLLSPPGGEQPHNPLLLLSEDGVDPPGRLRHSAPEPQDRQQAAEHSGARGVPRGRSQQLRLFPSATPPSPPANRSFSPSPTSSAGHEQTRRGVQEGTGGRRTAGGRRVDAPRLLCQQAHPRLVALRQCGQHNWCFLHCTGK